MQQRAGEIEGLKEAIALGEARVEEMKGEVRRMQGVLTSAEEEVSSEALEIDVILCNSFCFQLLKNGDTFWGEPGGLLRSPKPRMMTLAVEEGGKFVFQSLCTLMPLFEGTCRQDRKLLLCRVHEALAFVVQSSDSTRIRVADASDESLFSLQALRLASQW
jgi:hypothetical protein